MGANEPEPGSAFWNARYEDVERLWSLNPNTLLADFVGGLAPGRALDIGAGEGRNAIFLAQAGWRVTALDVSDVGLARAGTRAAEEGVELECVVAAWREYTPAGRFDLVVMAFMHPRPDDRAEMFMRAGEMLVPGGHLFTVGVDLAEHGRRGPPDAGRLLTVERLRGALGGLDLVRCESVAYEGEGKEGRRAVVDVVAIARRPGGDAEPPRPAR
ncbi:MAG: class I SAM-dependent methyltransferase [Thermoleophilaceae bacterium]